MNTVSISEVPVVDVSRFAAGTHAERSEIAHRIRTISTELGFIYLAGTAIDQSAIDAMLARSAAWFALPQADKHTFATPYRLGGGLNAGYVPPGREHEDATRPSDIKEAFDIFCESGFTADAFPPPTDAAPPAASAALLAAFADYHARCVRVANDVLRAFAIGFGLADDYFIPLHGGNNMLRLLHYPPVPADAAANAMRVGAHTDFGTLTLLAQDPSGGLEVLSADGRWLYAPRIPGTILINIGDLLQQWTNGEFRSTQHRVAVPSDARALASRYSIAFFCEPNNDTRIACLPAARESDRPRFAPVLAGDHMRARLSQTLIQKA